MQINICAVVISKHFPPQIVPLVHTLHIHEHKGVMSIPVDVNYDLYLKKIKLYQVTFKMGMKVHSYKN